MIRATEIVTSATSGALTTPDALKAELQISGTADDAYLARRIASASSGIALECGRTFGREVVRDTFRRDRAWDGADRRRRDAPLILSRDMLASVDSVTDASGLELYLSAWYADLGAGLLYRVPSAVTGGWYSGPLVVVFTSGWVLPGAANATLPAVIEDVCLERAAAAYHARGRDTALVSETAEGVGSLRYSNTSAAAVQDARLAPFVVSAR